LRRSDHKPPHSPMSKQRDRGRILTSAALTKLQQAIRNWEVRHEKKCTQERIKELTGEFKEGGLDPGTISKILKGKEGVDPESIRYLLRTFGLQLEETDLVAATAFTTQGDPNFVGREGAIADLKTLIDRGTKVIVIQARGGVGKTTLARKYLQQEFGTFLEFPIAKETKDIASVESLIEEKLRQLGEEPGREFLVSIDRLKRKLQSERIGILIDNLEPALDSAGKLIEAHRRYVELLRVLTDPTVRSLTLITTRERLREPSITVQHYPLRSLDVAAWETYFQSRNIATEESALSALHNAYGGNAKAMDILSGAIAEDFSGDIAAYWQVNQDDLLIERDLEDLVTTQFNRIQELDGDAYNLLCRMGCYRYQDVPRVPIEGLLCLLWDVAEGQRRRVVKALQDRSLVDCQDGEYWLHPVIRGEAIGRLRDSRDWEETNRKAAKFWIVNIETIRKIGDALRALEAFHHYLEIKDFDKAGSVILQERVCSLPEPEQLGRSLYKIGLSQQLESTISLIINKINNSYELCQLYVLLGVSNQILGNIHEAISYHERLIEVIDGCSEVSTRHHSLLEQAKFEKVIRQARLSIAICKMELGEVRESIELFEDLNSIIQTGRGSTFILIALGFLYSCLDDKDAASAFAKKACVRKNNERNTSGYGLFFLGITYKKLGKFDTAKTFLTQSINHAELNHYSQVKARSISGLGEVEREQGDYESAVLRHMAAIELLQPLGAKLDLAETHYQLGITYQKMGDIERGYKEFQEAIRLFTEMEAPKQVERVRRSMNNQV
jgi:tetratricopeptide (TPR) repeat protein